MITMLSPASCSSSPRSQWIPCCTSVLLVFSEKRVLIFLVVRHLRVLVSQDRGVATELAMLSFLLLFLTPYAFLEADPEMLRDILISPTPKHVFVVFYASWCGHCRAFEPKFHYLAGKINDQYPHIEVVRVDADKYGPALFQIEAYPTIALYTSTSDGEQQGKGEGEEEEEEGGKGETVAENADNYNNHHQPEQQPAPATTPPTPTPPTTTTTTTTTTTRLASEGDDQKNTTEGKKKKKQKKSKEEKEKEKERKRVLSEAISRSRPRTLYLGMQEPPQVAKWLNRLCDINLNISDYIPPPEEEIPESLRPLYDAFSLLNTLNYSAYHQALVKMMESEDRTANAAAALNASFSMVGSDVSGIVPCDWLQPSIKLLTNDSSHPPPPPPPPPQSVPSLDDHPISLVIRLDFRIWRREPSDRFLRRVHTLPGVQVIRITGSEYDLSTEEVEYPVAIIPDGLPVLKGEKEEVGTVLNGMQPAVVVRRAADGTKRLIWVAHAGALDDTLFATLARLGSEGEPVDGSDRSTIDNTPHSTLQQQQPLNTQDSQHHTSSHHESKQEL